MNGRMEGWGWESGREPRAGRDGVSMPPLFQPAPGGAVPCIQQGHLDVEAYGAGRTAQGAGRVWQRVAVDMDRPV